MREFHVENKPIQITDCDINLQDCPVLHYVSNKQLNCTLYGEEIIEFWSSNKLPPKQITDTVRDICRICSLFFKQGFYAEKPKTR